MSLPRRTVRYFLSYAHADSPDVNRLTGLLDPLLTAAADFHFERWSDHQIRLGQPWRQEIDQALETCDFGLMLVSPRFVASTFIGEKEVPPLLRKSIVIPVALHEIPFDGSLRLWGLEQLQFFLHDNQPFDYFDRERDQRAFANQLFRRLLQELRTATPPAATPAPGTPPAATPAPVAPARKPELAKPPSAVDALLAELATPATPHQRRHAIGQRLAELGDPRPGTGVIHGTPDILWRSIPGGVVELEDGAGRFPVEPFHIAAYPITLAQFQAFRPDHKQKTPANHPAIEVSWHDATEFCQWLSEKLGYEVRLPDEQEWQWAAQSAQKNFAYPWGTKWQDGLANTIEAKLRGTTAVGVYPQGDSQQQVSDLAGNVWEWCRNLYQSGEEWRCLRGGSLCYDRERARAGDRFRNRPVGRRGYLGFRVVCSAPIR